MWTELFFEIMAEYANEYNGLELTDTECDLLEVTYDYITYSFYTGLVDMGFSYELADYILNCVF